MKYAKFKVHNGKYGQDTYLTISRKMKTVLCFASTQSDQRVTQIKCKCAIVLLYNCDFTTQSYALNTGQAWLKKKAFFLQVYCVYVNIRFLVLKDYFYNWNRDYLNSNHFNVLLVVKLDVSRKEETFFGLTFHVRVLSLWLCHWPWFSRGAKILLVDMDRLQVLDGLPRFSMDSS